MMKPHLLNEALPVCDLGEGPNWSLREQKLYWVDINGKKLHRCAADGSRHEFRSTPSTIGFAVQAENGDIIAGLQDAVYRFGFDVPDVKLLADVKHAHPDNRFNDGKCDPNGRLWCGTMNNADHSINSGALYRFNAGGLHQQEHGVHISNGLGWSPDAKTMYYSDTVPRVVWKYDYDLETGAATNRRVFAHFNGEGRPDGLCVDSQGRVLVALWPGYGVEIYAPDGKLETRIVLPVPQVSSCAFGGEDLKTLYITTARSGMSADALRDHPLSGQVFAVDMDVAGRAETPFAGGL